MSISNKIYPRAGDAQTVYLKNVITNPNIKIGDYTMYNDFVNDPSDFEQNVVGGVPAKPTVWIILWRFNHVYEICL